VSVRALTNIVFQNYVAVNNLLSFIVRFKHWFLFALLEIISLILLFQFNSYQGSVFFSSANVVVGQVNAWSADVTQFFSLVEKNEQLSRHNINLQRKVNALTRELNRATHDTTFTERRLIHLLAGYKMVNAKVVSSSIKNSNNYITIDKGSADGIKEEQGVVSGSGVVGIVYLVSKHYSLVIPAINTKSNISCRIRKKDYFGYLHWEGGSSRYAMLDDIPRHAHFKKGDFVETSGYSSVFPEGILVGQVGKAYNSRDGLSYRLNVHLATDFSTLRDVSVIISDHINERHLLEERAKQAEKEEN